MPRERSRSASSARPNTSQVVRPPSARSIVERRARHAAFRELRRASDGEGVEPEARGRAERDEGRQGRRAARAGEEGIAEDRLEAGGGEEGGKGKPGQPALEGSGAGREAEPPGRGEDCGDGAAVASPFRRAVRETAPGGSRRPRRGRGRRAGRGPSRGGSPWRRSREGRRARTPPAPRRRAPRPPRGGPCARRERSGAPRSKATSSGPTKRKEAASQMFRSGSHSWTASQRGAPRFAFRRSHDRALAAEGRRAGRGRPSRSPAPPPRPRCARTRRRARRRWPRRRRGRRCGARRAPGGAGEGARRARSPGVSATPSQPRMIW